MRSLGLGPGAIPDYAIGPGGNYSHVDFQWIILPSDGVLKKGTNTFELCGGGGLKQRLHPDLLQYSLCPAHEVMDSASGIRAATLLPQGAVKTSILTLRSFWRRQS